MDTEYIYAAAILHELEREINEKSMKSVLNAAGADVSESRIKALIAALEDVDIDQAVNDASAELAAGTPGQGQAQAAVPADADESDGVEPADETLPEKAEDQETDDTGGRISDMF
jgi:large subunit ribosomal protein L12